MRNNVLSSIAEILWIWYLEEEEAGAEAGQLAGGHGEVEGWAVGGGQELETKEDQPVLVFTFI